MIEGELKMRIDGLLVDRCNMHLIHKVLDEAKSEFPIGGYGYDLLTLEDCRKLLAERHQWFKTWFGE